MIKKTLVALGLAALIGTPALAQSMTGVSTAAAAKSYASDTSKAKAKKSATIAKPRSASPYSTNPEYDVYFRGEYVGSDPDPRVRWTLRNEARRSYGINN